jgi:hypothetical protein
MPRPPVVVLHAAVLASIEAGKQHALNDAERMFRKCVDPIAPAQPRYLRPSASNAARGLRRQKSRRRGERLMSTPNAPPASSATEGF